MHLAEGVYISSPSMLLQLADWMNCHATTHMELRSQLQDHRGYGMGKYPSKLQVLWWPAVIYFDVEYSHSFEEGPQLSTDEWFLYPCFPKQEETINTNNSTRPDEA